MNGSKAHELGAGDSIDRDAPGGTDADADAAVADPDATGHGPQALTVPGHTAFIDTRKLTGKPVKRDKPGTEAELRTTRSTADRPCRSRPRRPALAAPAPIVNVLGLDFNTWGAGHPPDTNGVIGPNHFVQSVNTSVGIFNKSTGARISAFTFDDFFANSGTAECDANNGGDPTVGLRRAVREVGHRRLRLDQRRPAGRSTSASPSRPATTRSPSTWTFYSVPAGDGHFPDYPKFGSGPDAVYFTTNNFRATPTSAPGSTRSGGPRSARRACRSARDHSVVVLQPAAGEPGRRGPAGRAGVHHLDLERTAAGVAVHGRTGPPRRARPSPASPTSPSPTARRAASPPRVNRWTASARGR